MKFCWVLTFLAMSLSVGSSKNDQFKPAPTKTVRIRNQRSISTLNCIGLHCNVRYSTDPIAAKTSTNVRPRTTTQSKRDAKETQPSKNFEAKDEKFSVIGTFFKLVTRGLLKKIALPAIVRLSMAEDSQRGRRAKKLVKITRAQWGNILNWRQRKI